MLPMEVGPGKLQFFTDMTALVLQNTEITITMISPGGELDFNYYIYGQSLKLTGQYSEVDFEKESKYDPNSRDFKNISNVYTSKAIT